MKTPYIVFITVFSGICILGLTFVASQFLGTHSKPAPSPDTQVSAASLPPARQDESLPATGSSRTGSPLAKLSNSLSQSTHATVVSGSLTANPASTYKPIKTLKPDSEANALSDSQAHTQSVSKIPAGVAQGPNPSIPNQNLARQEMVNVPQGASVPAVLAQPDAKSALDPVSQKEVQTMADNFLNSVNAQTQSGTPQDQAWNQQQASSDDAFRARYGWEAFNAESARANEQSRPIAAP